MLTGGFASHWHWTGAVQENQDVYAAVSVISQPLAASPAVGGVVTSWRCSEPQQGRGAGRGNCWSPSDRVDTVGEKSQEGAGAGADYYLLTYLPTYLLQLL